MEVVCLNTFERFEDYKTSRECNKWMYDDMELIYAVGLDGGSAYNFSEIHFKMIWWSKLLETRIELQEFLKCQEIITTTKLIKKDLIDVLWAHMIPCGTRSNKQYYFELVINRIEQAERMIASLEKEFGIETKEKSK